MRCQETAGGQCLDVAGTGLPRGSPQGGISRRAFARKVSSLVPFRTHNDGQIRLYAGGVSSPSHSCRSGHYAIQDQCHEADAGVRADAFGQAVEHECYLDFRLQHPEPALDVSQALVTVDKLRGLEVDFR